MSFFDTILLNSLCVLFPILIYVIFLSNENNKQINCYLFEITLFSTLFLIIKLNGNNYNNYSLLLINIPLLFSYIRNKKKLSLVLSILLVLYCYYYLKYNIVILICEYLTYYLLHIIRFKSLNKNYSINVFTIVKCFYFSLYVYYYNNSNILLLTNSILVSILVFYICSNFYYYILIKGEEIISLNTTLKELDKEKALRNSLFKLTHEIKNPIAVCKGYLDMIDINDKKSLKKRINIIKSEIDRTLVIMDDFLDYTKIKVDKDIMDIILLIEDTISSTESFFIKNNVKSNINVKYDEIYINGDYNRLKQVLVNIIKNSIESCLNKSNPLIKIDVFLAKKEVKITISDNGIGMSEETLNNLGKAFYTTKRNGTGLGISLSKEIIEQHNGSIIYTSEIDKGTTTEIVLPIIEINNC